MQTWWRIALPHLKRTFSCKVCNGTKIHQENKRFAQMLKNQLLALLLCTLGLQSQPHTYSDQFFLRAVGWVASLLELWFIFLPQPQMPASLHFIYWCSIYLQSQLKVSLLWGILWSFPIIPDSPFSQFRWNSQAPQQFSLNLILLCYSLIFPVYYATR